MEFSPTSQLLPEPGISCKVPFAQGKSVSVTPVLGIADNVPCSPTGRGEGGGKLWEVKGR